MRILHFSDIHLDFDLHEVPWRDWAGKRLLGGGNYLLRRREHFKDGRPKVEALVELVREEEIEVVIFSGDFTTLGTEREMAAARSEIAPMLEVAPQFVCVPGNHDVYLKDVLRQGRFERYFGDLLRTDVEELSVDGPWPLVRLFGDHVAAVAVNSARPNPRPWRSSGRIPTRQLSALERVWAHPALADRFVFVVTHYSPCLPGGQPDTRQHGLENAEDLLAAIAPLGDRGALLCGHVHRCFTVQPDPAAPPVFCGGSATYSGREGCWLFDIERARRVRTESGSWSAEGWSFSAR